jgi:hypothetical protein
MSSVQGSGFQDPESGAPYAHPGHESWLFMPEHKSI